MTEKIYDFDSYIKEFDAKVISCIKCEKGYEIVLDRTAFFPEEGGQCCDKGNINNIAVTDVQIKNNIIYHYCESKISEGTSVHGEIDFGIRFRNMQNHTGEHILCGIAHRLYGYENVGFHLGDDIVTMDLSGPLSKEQLEEIETLANETVFKNYTVKTYYPDDDKLRCIPYRSKDDIKGAVRIVEIENCDICACCAPHVKKTGEVGLIKILDSYPHRGGVRISIICGFDALKDYRLRCSESLAVSNLLSVRQNDIAKGVQKLLDDMGELKHKLSLKSKAMAMSIINNMKETENSIIIFEDDIDRDTMRLIANEGMKKTERVFAVMSGNDQNGYVYILSSETVDLKEKARDINSALNGKGGGSRTMISGNFSKSKENIEAYIKTI